ncbi:MAG: hypothetical protein LAN71_17195 [Acidobacteriia bacterium]|nr:hypothetical protein [Terriglobia bacterium]
MEIIVGQKGLEEFNKINKGRMDQIHMRPMTEDEFLEHKIAGMEEIRAFCESLRTVHESHLVADPLKEIKEEKVAVFWCFTFDKDIIDEVKMYEMETGIKIVIMVEVLFDDLGKVMQKFVDEKYEPTQKDITWLKSLVDNLSIKGHWAAPMGFLFEKTGDDEITLIEVKNDKALFAICQTIKVGQVARIKVII